MKKNYKEPTISRVKLDKEMNLVLMSNPPMDPEMMMEMSEETDVGIFPQSQFFNPMKWFR